MKITSAKSNAPRLSTEAARIADLLSDWAGEVAQLSDHSDFLDEYDDDAIGQTIDALYYFAQAFATDRNGID